MSVVTLPNTTKTPSQQFTSKFFASSKLPLVIEPANSSMSLEQFLTLVNSNQNEFKKLLLQYGGILFRNFPISNEHDFASVVKGLNHGKMIDYIGGDSPRNKIIEGVYTSTEAPPSIKIALHNELSYVKNYPKHIYFYCQIAPEKDGETIIADSREVYRSIDPEVRNRFIEKGLRYESCYHYKNAVLKVINRFHKSWINVFETSDKKEVERLCYENEFEFKWNNDDWIKIIQKRPAVLFHPETKDPIWFNQAHLFDFNPKLLGWPKYLATKLLYWRKHTRLHEVYFGDGTKIPRIDLYHILDVLDANTIKFPWQKGDILVLDNVLAMHGRATFTGKRRVLTAMT